MFLEQGHTILIQIGISAIVGAFLYWLQKSFAEHLAGETEELLRINETRRRQAIQHIAALEQIDATQLPLLSPKLINIERIMRGENGIAEYRNRTLLDDVQYSSTEGMDADKPIIFEELIHRVVPMDLPLKEEILQ